MAQKQRAGAKKQTKGAGEARTKGAAAKGARTKTKAAGAKQPGPAPAKARAATKARAASKSEPRAAIESRTRSKAEPQAEPKARTRATTPSLQPQAPMAVAPANPVRSMGQPAPRPYQPAPEPLSTVAETTRGPLGPASLAKLMGVDADATLPFSAYQTEELWVLYREEARLVAERFGLDLRPVVGADETEVEEEELEEGLDRRRLRPPPTAAELAAAEAEEQAAAGEDAEPAAAEEDGPDRPSPLRPSRSPSLKDLPKSPRLEALRNELIERHYPLVRYIAERLLQTLPRSIELDDLVSAGQFGLMDAIRGFDPERGIKFKTYCSTRIRGSILDQLRSQDWVPRLVRLRASRIEKAYQRLTGEFGREPTHAELARELEMDHHQLSSEMEQAQARTMFSLSEKWDDDDDGSVEKVEIIEDQDAIDPVTELNRRDLMKYITRSLTHKERFIIEQYYQFGHTMREIGEMLMLTESRVCQIHSNVMGRLKQLLSQRTETLNG